ncbi:MAG: sulfotransferase [Phormidesmis sp.]
MAPVIVVGLPRSGSSFLSHVLSCMDNWYIFDDLYPYQKAISLGIDNSTNLAEDPEKLKQYINSLTWQLRAKIKFEKNFEVPNLSLEDTFSMEEKLLGAFSHHVSLTWDQVLEEWISRLARHSGKAHWGYKTPQDFMHMDKLTDTFPGVRFIYILRDPRKVMRSFKSLPRVKTHGTEDGESRQYHPMVYALYWKTAYDKVQSFVRSGRAPVATVRFEDLVAAPQATATRLADFLCTTVQGDINPRGVNSSFSKGSVCELTAMEVKICEKIAGNQMKAAGYTLSNPQMQAYDSWDLLKTSAEFASYQTHRALTNRRGRSSIQAFIKSLGK